MKVGGRKIYSLACADDMAVVAEDEGGMKGMIKVVEKYVEKGLEVNVEKTKVVRCRKEGGRWRKGGLEVEGMRVIEEVRKFKYLRYILMANGRQRKQVKKKDEKGTIVMKEGVG